jgi:hypothetical protein
LPMMLLARLRMLRAESICSISACIRRGGGRIYDGQLINSCTKLPESDLRADVILQDSAMSSTGYRL